MTFLALALTEKLSAKTGEFLENILTINLIKEFEEKRVRVMRTLFLFCFRRPSSKKTNCRVSSYMTKKFQKKSLTKFFFYAIM